MTLLRLITRAVGFGSFVAGCSLALVVFIAFLNPEFRVWIMTYGERASLTFFLLMAAVTFLGFTLWHRRENIWKVLAASVPGMLGAYFSFVVFLILYSFFLPLLR